MAKYHICPRCRYHARKLRMVVKHSQNSVKVMVLYRCDYCGKRFTREPGGLG